MAELNSDLTVELKMQYAAPITLVREVMKSVASAAAVSAVVQGRGRQWSPSGFRLACQLALELLGYTRKEKSDVDASTSPAGD